MRNRHAVPNALLPVVTLIAINFGFVLSGAIAVEAIFSWPGLGLAHARGAHGPGPPDAAGPVPLFSAAVILFNLVADLLYAYLDPRVRHGDERPSAAPRSAPPRIAWLRRRRALAGRWAAVPPAIAPGHDRAGRPASLFVADGRSPRRCSPTQRG